MSRTDGAQFFRHSAELVEDRLLHGDIEGTRRLVGDQESGVACQADGDEGALAHATGELVRILLRALRGIREPGVGQRVDDSLGDVPLGRQAVSEECLSHLRADLRHGVEVGHGVLRHQADLRPANSAHHSLRRADQFLPVEGDAAPGDRAVAGEQPDQRHRGRGFARARFADDRDGLARADLEVDGLDGVHRAVDRAEVDREVAHLEEWSGRGRRHATILHRRGASCTGRRQPFTEL